MSLLLSLPLRRVAAAALVWLAAGLTGAAQAQTTGAACVDAAATSQPQLLGRWTAQFGTPAAQASPLQALPTAATLELTPHPELSASVRGRVLRAGTQTLVAGDVDEGDFTLEESINGTNISATWIGQVVQGSCGKEIRGTWSQATPPLTLSFVLRKQPGE